MCRSSSVLAIALVFGACTGARAQDDAPARDSRPVVLTVALEDEAITPATVRFLDRAISQAEDQRAECLVVILDTPGGLLISTRRIVKRMMASETPIVVYVAPPGSRAASAGVFLTLAAHVAAMAPSTTIGAAHPVQVGGLPVGPRPGESGDDGGDSQTTMEGKIVNDTVAWARALARRRERNADWAADAVLKSDSLTASEAVEKGVVDFVADDLDELLARLDGREISLPQRSVTLETRDARVERISMWWGERVLSLIANPNVAFLLLMFGFYGILFELYSPGWGVPGTLGVVCMLLGLFGLSVLPVNYLGLALIAVAFALLTAEVFVTSYGALAVAGTACLVLGAVTLIDSPAGFARVSLSVALPVAAATAAIVLLLVSGIVRSHRARVQTGGEGMIGEQARAGDAFSRTNGDYQGRVFIHGETWRAVSGQPIGAGEACRVRDREGLTLVVEPAGEDKPASRPAEPAG
ncbi:MAG: nodulation protein NfeD [Planctomycetes bacterium]|nr:nodulation protein NfeD [Planctomycetota bacterium]